MKPETLIQPGFSSPSPIPPLDRGQDRRVQNPGPKLLTRSMARLNEGSVPVDALNIGLDRAAINKDGQIQLPKKHEHLHNGPGSVQPVKHQEDVKHVRIDSATVQSPTSHSKLDSLKERTHETSSKIKKALHIRKTSADSGRNSDNPPAILNTVNENSDSRLMNKLPEPEKRTMHDLVHNPVETVKSKVSGEGNHQVAANIAAKEVPHGQEVDLVNAQTAVERARTESERLLAIDNLAELMKDRQSTFARWTLDRHVTKLRVIPKETFVLKPKEAFMVKNVRGEIEFDYKAYWKHVKILT